MHRSEFLEFSPEMPLFSQKWDILEQNCPDFSKNRANYAHFHEKLPEKCAKSLIFQEILDFLKGYTSSKISQK